MLDIFIYIFYMIFGSKGWTVILEMNELCTQSLPPNEGRCTIPYQVAQLSAHLKFYFDTDNFVYFVDFHLRCTSSLISLVTGVGPNPLSAWHR